MKRRIWIDVTDFLKWQGNFTGFQHIQYNIAKLYLESDHDVVFFIYEEQRHAFQEVDFDPDKLAVDGIRSETTAAHSKSLATVAKRLTPVRVKRVIKKLAGRTTAPRPAEYHTNSPFQKGDVVVVLGGIWHGSFAADMAREKQKRGFLFVHVVHDMVPVVCPQCVVEDLPEVFAAYKAKIFTIADGLLINSQSSKRDAIAYMKQHHIAVPKSVVFRLADDVASGVTPTPVAQLKSKDFLLSLGTIEGRKNHMLLYYVYKEAARREIKLPKLVIAGRHGWLVEDFFYIVSRDPQVKDQIVILEGVTNGERAWLFKHCLMTVWPSFYEGWGMPVAEGLGYGKVALSTDTASMPEIGGKLVDYFSPFDSAACLKLITEYLDPEVRAKREQEIKKHYRPTTWRDMYQTISTFIDSL